MLKVRASSPARSAELSQPVAEVPNPKRLMWYPGSLNGSWHTRNDSGFWGFDENAPATRGDVPRSPGAVVAHPREHDTDSPIAEYARRRAEQLIDRGHVASPRVGRGHPDRWAAVRRNDVDALTARANVRMPSCQALVRFCLRHVRNAVPVQSSRESLGEPRRHVLGNDQGGVEVSMQVTEQREQCSRPAG